MDNSCKNVIELKLWTTIRTLCSGFVVGSMSKITLKDRIKPDAPLAQDCLKINSITTFSKAQETLMKWKKDSEPFKFWENRWRNEHPGEDPPMADTRIECAECHGYFRYDHVRDEMVCTQCGLTDIVDARRFNLNPDLLPVGWTPPEQKIFFDGIGKGDLYHHPDSPEFPHGSWRGLEETSRYEPEQEETSDDDDIVCGVSGDYDSLFVGSDAKDVRDRGDLSLKRWTYSNPHKYFTHYRFCRTVFRRCQIGIENLPISCCNQMGSKYCKTKCKFTVDGLPINCYK